jgi:glutamyl-tRNA reductase
MQYRAVCLDLVNTPIAQFERIASAIHSSAGFPETIARRKGIEFVFLSTCNRAEFYFSVTPSSQACSVKALLSEKSTAIEIIQSAIDALFMMLSERCECSIAQMKAWANLFENIDVIAHLFKTTAGLNSIAVGETQIQGQVKDAYLNASKAGLVGKNLNALFEAALHAGKRARTETGIEQARISVGNLAIRSLQDNGAFSNAIKTVIIGTGKMAKNAAEYLLRNGISRDLVFLTRHPEKRCQQLACYYARVQHLESLIEHLHTADLVFAAYGTEELFITRALLQRVIEKRKNPLYLIDIAMPRDIDPGVVELPGVRLIDFFALKKMKDDHPMLRSGEFAVAEKIIAEEVQAYLQMQKLRKASTVISHFRSQAESLRRKELEHTFNKLSHLNTDDREIIQKLTYNIVNKILNPPTVKIRQKALAGQLRAGDFQLIDEIFS